MTTLTQGQLYWKHLSEMIILAGMSERRELLSPPVKRTDWQGRARSEWHCWETAVGDVLSSKQYPKYPPQDPLPHRKPWDVARMSPNHHIPLHCNSGACRTTAAWTVRCGRCCIHQIEFMILSPKSIYGVKRKGPVLRFGIWENTDMSWDLHL